MCQQFELDEYESDAILRFFRMDLAAFESYVDEGQNTPAAMIALWKHMRNLDRIIKLSEGD